MGKFDCWTQIISADAGEVLGQLGAQRLLMVSDPFFQKGTAQQLGQASGAQVEYFFDVEPDPTVTLAAKGAAQVKDFRPDAVVALGGGSAMDLAKAMLWFSGSDAKLTAIPTTSGSGSEVTDFAVLTHEGVKHPLVDPALRPQRAVLDATLVQKLPKSLVAEGGFDALTHALEAYTANNANRFTDALAAAAFRTLLQNLEDSYRGNLTARKAVHEAATMAGLAFTRSGLGLCHGVSHALGGALHLPHGRLNAVLLPAVMEENLPACADRYAALARLAGLEGRSETMAVRNLKNALLGLRKRLSIPENLPQGNPDLPAITRAVLADPCCQTNPMPVTADMVGRVLSKVLKRG